MSIYSTLHITESKAKALLFDQHFGHLSTQELEDRLDALLAPRLNNAIIVPDGTPNNDDEQLY
jgi:hypothetical protein